MRFLMVFSASLVLAACASLAEAPSPAAEADSPFVGRYDGSSFETAQAMDVLPDGSFRWGLTVGGLDLSASGRWRAQSEYIFFESVPRPMPPEFRYLGLGENAGDRLVSVKGADGSVFDYVDVVIGCADGSTEHQNVIGSNAYYNYGDNNPPKCKTPVSVTLSLDSYELRSKTYDLAELGWTDGKSLQFEFVPNDIGAVDFTGTYGRLVEGILQIDGPLGRLELRKQLPNIRTNIE